MISFKSIIFKSTQSSCKVINQVLCCSSSKFIGILIHRLLNIVQFGLACFPFLVICSYWWLWYRTGPGLKLKPLSISTGEFPLWEAATKAPSISLCTITSLTFLLTVIVGFTALDEKPSQFYLVFGLKNFLSLVCVPLFRVWKSLIISLRFSSYNNIHSAAVLLTSPPDAALYSLDLSRSSLNELTNVFFPWCLDSWLRFYHFSRRETLSWFHCIVVTSGYWSSSYKVKKSIFWELPVVREVYIS